ncbi:sarcosine oxidase subunit gamma [Amycolatopsis taiwanensis]|uniref:sarcosine oxidase subunit gamma n=1 Tax=Amycolatopsis taiwanensis TaxID=342230 RepID=UPI0004893513|nr:sarcosine oxidase subunit gamma family protein [Amycolatopsis taiwanensis]
MGDTLYRAHPLEAWKPALAELTSAVDGLVVRAEDEIAAVDLRIDPAGPGAEALGRMLGAALPVEPNTWTHTADGQIIWLGPDEWLVTSARSLPHELEHDLGWAASAYDGAAVDVSAQRTSIRLRGSLARELLSFGCSLDLRPSVFSAGSSAQTLVGRAGVLILALGEEDLRLFVRPSFAGYLAEWLLDAAEEFRP